MGKPAICLVKNGFVTDAESAASRAGMPGIRIVPENVPSESSVLADIEEGIFEAVDEIINALTKPLTTQEKTPKREEEKPTRITFKGNLEDVNRFFYMRGWTDGLPVIPPTEEAVKEMLMGTDLPKDHLVADIPPMNGHATVEKIAVNAVMAGCLPTYMPLLIAGIECMMQRGKGTREDPYAAYALALVSAGSWSPLWIINGPIRDQLNINYGIGALGHGRIANKAIARALYLITKNIGGSREGVECMASLGNPWKSCVVGEDEAHSPWEPLSSQAGFRQGDSTISVTVPNQLVMFLPYGTDAKGVLQAIVSNAPPQGRATTVMFTVDNANTLAKSGYTKEKLIDYLHENLVVPAKNHPDYYSCSPNPATRTPEVRAALPKDPNTPMKITIKDQINVFVAGGPTMIALFAGGHNVVTKKAQLPADWDQLVQKYKNIIPQYALY